MERAAALYAESLALRRTLGDSVGIATSLSKLALVAFKQGCYERAVALYRESLGFHRDLGDRWDIAECLEGLASVIAALRDVEQAARIWGATEALRDAIGAPLPPSEHASYQRAIQAARAQLDAPLFASAWMQGRSLTLEQAIEEALGWSIDLTRKAALAPMPLTR